MGTPKEAYLRLSEDVRRKIEETAVALYAQHPYNAVTARLICRTLKINSATLYRWFDSKDDLYIYLMKTLMDKETFPENLVWDMDDFIVQKIRTGECYTDNERKFLVSWQHIPENVLAKLVFEGVFFDDALIRYNLLRMQQAGEVRPNLNIDFTVYIYSTLSYNIQRFINERGIEDPEEVRNIQHFAYYDLLRLGIKGQYAENENEKSVGDLHLSTPAIQWRGCKCDYILAFLFYCTIRKEGIPACLSKTEPFTMVLAAPIPAIFALPAAALQRWEITWNPKQTKMCLMPGEWTSCPALFRRFPTGA